MNCARTQLPSQTSDCCTASFPSPPPSSLPASLSSPAWSLAHSTSNVSECPWSLPLRRAGAHHVASCFTLQQQQQPQHNLHSLPTAFTPSVLVPICNKPVTGERGVVGTPFTRWRNWCSERLCSIPGPGGSRGGPRSLPFSKESDAGVLGQRRGIPWNLPRERRREHGDFLLVRPQARHLWLHEITYLSQ